MEQILSMKSRFNNILAVIPARGGSKGIPKKNIAKLHGKPLIAYTIDAALNSKYVNRTIVWTDCPRIAETAESCGAEVPFLRHPDLATDKAKLSEAIFNLYDELYAREKYESSIYLVLFPTYPFKTWLDIDRLLEDILAGTYVSYLVSRSSFRKYNAYIIENCSLRSLKNRIQNHSPHPTFYKSNNSITARLHPPWKRMFGKSFHDQFRSLQAFYHEMVQKGLARRKIANVLRDNMRTIDIDYLDQLQLAEGILSRNLFDFNGCFDEGYGRLSPNQAS